MDAFAWIAERRIREAQELGAFDRLPGTGRPLALDDDPLIPDELWLAHKILKNAGCVPAEVEQRREIHQLEELLAAMPDEKERTRAETRLAMLRTRMELSRLNAPAAVPGQYQQALSDRLTRPVVEGCQNGSPRIP